MNISSIIKKAEINLKKYSGNDLAVFSPIDGEKITSLKLDNLTKLNKKIENASIAFNQWRLIPAPKRGEFIRIFANELRQEKENLAKLVTIECGKIYEEGLGEVQEMIDICDFAIGLSRTVGGHTMPSERSSHIMQENWYPLGVVGVISAFNFPVAVWAWNFALAIICGNSVIWKPSEKTPLTAIYCQQIFENAAKKSDIAVPKNLSQITIGDREIGQSLVEDKRISLVSATGSCQMGAKVGPVVAKRFGKCLLELGGNNAVIITENADLDVAIPSVVFGAVGTAGQRCTTTRRAFVHKKIYKEFCKKISNAYKQVNKKIGNPLEQKNLIGPLIDEASFNRMQEMLDIFKKKKVKIEGGKRALSKTYPDAFYVQPAIVFAKKQDENIMQETFAPILYIMPYESLEDVMIEHNAVSQGLSSAIFTTDIREAEYFKQHSDCGIANVNIGTSGAEIGGAFGGEKETGGGRESGSDSWKAYMRRQTCTTYYGNDKPELAQGIKFG